MKEALSPSETSVLTRATRHNIPEDAIRHGHRRENLKSYIDSNYLTENTLSCISGGIISNALDFLFSFYLTPNIVQVFKVSHPQQSYSFLLVFLLYKEVIYTYICYYTNI
jgi:hypothetical protein